MFHLCQVMGIILSLFILWGPPAHAALGSLRIGTNSGQASGSLFATWQPLTAASWNQSAQFVEITSPTLAKHWVIKGSVSSLQRPAILLRTYDRNLAEVHLSPSQYGQDLLIGGGISYLGSRALVSVLSEQSSQDSILARARQALELNFNWHERASNIIFAYNRSAEKRPLTYYRNALSEDPLLIRARPTFIERHRWSLGVEQLWNDHYKTRTEISAINSNQERPKSIALSLKHNLSLNSRNSIRVDMGHAQENQSEPLRDERGNFQMNWVEARYTLLLTYNLLAAVSYGFLQELEEQPFIDSLSQVASDVYGIKLQYLGQGWTTNFDLQISQANTQFSSTYVQGSLQWEL